MEKFLEKYFSQKQLNISNITGFLAEFCEKKGKSPNAQQLTAIVQLIQMGQLNLHSVCIEACTLVDFQLYTIYDSTGNVLCYKLLKNGEIKEKGNS